MCGHGNCQRKMSLNFINQHLLSAATNHLPALRAMAWTQTQRSPSAPAAPQPHEIGGVSWEASEYIHHAKGVGWLLGLIAVMLVFAVIAFYTKAWTFLILVVVMGVALGIFAFRQPQVLHYVLNDQGLQIDDKFYNFDVFRS